MDAAGSGDQITSFGSSQPVHTKASATAAAFLPVSIIGDSATAELKIELANGCAVRLTGSIDPGLLQVAITAAGQLGGPGQGDH